MAGGGRVGDTIRAALIWRVFAGECKLVTPSVTPSLLVSSKLLILMEVFVSIG